MFIQNQEKVQTSFLLLSHYRCDTFMSNHSRFQINFLTEYHNDHVNWIYKCSQYCGIHEMQHDHRCCILISAYYLKYQLKIKLFLDNNLCLSVTLTYIAPKKMVYRNSKQGEQKFILKYVKIFEQKRFRIFYQYTCQMPPYIT